MTTPDEFGGCGFAIEPCRGVRSFDVDTLGRLRAVTYGYIWTPGENVAVCNAQTADGLISLVNNYMLTLSFGGAAKPADADKPVVDRTKPHSMTECGHGFYGYYDGSDDYYKPSRISGVIEGYGETIIGTRGFRSMKAKIVALCFPGDRPYEDTSMGGFVSAYSSKPKNLPRHLFARVRANYSDVPWFETFDAMVAEFPPDNATYHGAASDPEFWTRSAGKWS